MSLVRSRGTGRFGAGPDADDVRSEGMCGFKVGLEGLRTALSQSEIGTVGAGQDALFFLFFGDFFDFLYVGLRAMDV